MKYGQGCPAVQASKKSAAVAVKIPKRQRTGPTGWASETLPSSSAPAPPAVPAVAAAAAHGRAANMRPAALQSQQPDASEAIRPAQPPGSGGPSRFSAEAANTPSAPLLPAASAAQMLAQLQHYRMQQQQQQHVALAMPQGQSQALLRPFELSQQGIVPGASEPWLQAQQQFAAFIQLQQLQQQQQLQLAQPQHVPRLLQQQAHSLQQRPMPQMQQPTHHLTRRSKQARPHRRAPSALQGPRAAPPALPLALPGSAAQLGAEPQPYGSVQKPRQSSPPQSDAAKLPSQKLRAGSRASPPAPAAVPQVGARLAVSDGALPGPFLDHPSRLLLPDLLSECSLILEADRHLGDGRAN